MATARECSDNADLSLPVSDRGSFFRGSTLIDPSASSAGSCWRELTYALPRPHRRGFSLRWISAASLASRSSRKRTDFSTSAVRCLSRSRTSRAAPLSRSSCKASVINRRCSSRSLRVSTHALRHYTHRSPMGLTRRRPCGSLPTRLCSRRPVQCLHSPQRRLYRLRPSARPALPDRMRALWPCGCISTRDDGGAVRRHGAAGRVDSPYGV
jgi:hypothetical protein